MIAEHTGTSDRATTSAERRPPIRLEPARCCLCNLDDSEPVAVGADFEYRTSPDEFLAVRCRRCRLVYLNPRVAECDLPIVYPDHYHAFQFRPAEFGLIYRIRCRLEAKRLLRWCQGLPFNAKILDVGCGDGFHLGLLKRYGYPGWTLEGVDVDWRAVARARETGLTIHQGTVEQIDLPPGTQHLILMLMTVEHLSDPVVALRSAERLLAPGGRIVVVTDNVRSPDFALFGGRHWGGYHFPRHTYLFDKRTLAEFGKAAGLEVERITTAVSPVNWVYSLRNWLDDWGGPRWLVNRFSLKSAFSLGVFTLLDMPLAAIGRGAILQGIFRKPLQEKQPIDSRSFLKKLLDGPFRGPTNRFGGGS